jgi:hypothetical protein
MGVWAVVFFVNTIVTSGKHTLAASIYHAMACYVLLWRTRLRGGCTIAGITRCFFLMEPRFEHLQTFVKPYLNVRKPSQTFMNLHEATFERSQMFLNLCEPM